MSDDRDPNGDVSARAERRAAIVRRRQELARRVREQSPSDADDAPLDAVSWADTAAPIRLILDLRRKRKWRFLVRFGVFCALPTLLTLGYMLFVATPRYISEFEITYQTYQPQQSLSSGLIPTVFSGTTSGAVDLSTILYEYVRSPALMNKLDKQLHLREYYSSSNIDYLSRMSPDASVDNFSRYYLWFVSASQGEGGYLTVDVQAFDPDFALTLSRAIVKACDEMLDEMTARPRRDEVRNAEVLVTQAEIRVRKARTALTDFQNAHGDLNPAGSANQISSIVGSIEHDMSTQRALLSDLKASAPNSPQIAATKQRLASLEEQLRHEQTRLASATGTATFARLLDQYNALQLEQEFAKNAYMSAQQGLAVARASAAGKQNYLVDFAPPYRPDGERLRLALIYAFTVFIVTVALFGIGSLLAGATRDQAGL